VAVETCAIPPSRMANDASLVTLRYLSSREHTRRSLRHCTDRAREVSMATGLVTILCFFILLAMRLRSYINMHIVYPSLLSGLT
jgi:hypothetical protein